MRFFRPINPLDDLIGGLAFDAIRSKALWDPLDHRPLKERLVQPCLQAISYELRRHNTPLPWFLVEKSGFDKKGRSPFDNLFGYHLTEGGMRGIVLDPEHDWAQLLGWCLHACIEGVFGELMEAGL